MLIIWNIYTLRDFDKALPFYIPLKQLPLFKAADKWTQFFIRCVNVNLDSFPHSKMKS